MFARCCGASERSDLPYVCISGEDTAHRTLSLFSSRLACKWNNRTCKLFLHYEHGFTLYNDPTDSVTNGGLATSSANVRLLWQQPFEKLRSSADDNEHLLTLDFHGEEGVVVGIPHPPTRPLQGSRRSRNWILLRHRNRLSSIYMHFYRRKRLVLVSPDKIDFLPRTSHLVIRKPKKASCDHYALFCCRTVARSSSSSFLHTLPYARSPPYCNPFRVSDTRGFLRSFFNYYYYYYYY